MLAACLYLWDIMWGDESPAFKEAWQIKVIVIVAYHPHVCIVCQHTLPIRRCMFTCIVTRYLGHPHRPGVRLARYLRQDQACMCVCIQSTDDSHVFESHINMTFMHACMYIPRDLMASGEGSLDDSERAAQTSFDDVTRVGTLTSLPRGILCMPSVICSYIHTLSNPSRYTPTSTLALSYSIAPSHTLDLALPRSRSRSIATSIAPTRYLSPSLHIPILILYDTGVCIVDACIVSM